MKKRLLFVVALAASALGFKANAQTDVTEKYVKNADLTEDVTAEGNGWVCAERQDWQAATDATHVNVVEFYSGWGSQERDKFAISQTLTLPAGDYRIAVNAFYRHGDPGDNVNNGAAYIYAGEKVQDVETFTNAELDKYSGSSDLWKASNAFYLGKYSNEFDFTVEQDGDVEIGFKGTFDMYRCWVIFGPVKLYLYTAEDFAKEFDATVEKAKELYDVEMNVEVLKALKEAASADVTGKSKEEIVAATKALKKAIEAAEESIAVWKSYIDYIEGEVKNSDVLKLEGDVVSRLISYISDNEEPSEEFPNGSYQYIIETLTLSDSLLQVEKAWVAQLLVDALKDGMTEGTDISSLLVNPSFDDGFTGWTNKSTGQTTAAVGGLSTYKAVENYNAVVNVYQEVENVPDGIYSLTCYAFERPGNTADIANWETTLQRKTYLFMNDFQTDVQSILTSALPLSEAKDGEDCYITANDAPSTGSSNVDSHVFKTETGWADNNENGGEEYVIPNGMKGASYAFQAGRYEQTVYGLVEGGKMTIGLTSNGENVHWVLWKNFVLKFQGKSKVAIASVIESLTAQVGAFLTANQANISTPTYAAANSARTAAVAANATGDVDKMWDALIALNAAYNAAKESKSLLEQLATTQTELNDAYIAAENEGILTKAVKAEYEAYAGKVEKKAELSNDEVKTIIEDMKATIKFFDVLRDLDEAIAALEDAYIDADDAGTLSEKADEIYNDLQPRILGKADLSNEEIETLLEDVKYATAMMKIPADAEEASDANPVPMTSVIVNPSFEDGSIGWTWNTNATGDTGVKQVFNEDGDPILTDDGTAYGTYYVENAEGMYVFNTWHGSAPSGDFWLAQEIKALPAGTYEVSALVASDNGNEISLVTNTHKKSVATIVIPDVEVDEDADEDALPIGPKNVGHRVSNIFVLEEGATLEIKVTSKTWFKADDFQLTYFGAESAKVPTDINSVESTGNAAASAIYTVSGAKVSSLQKGINIVKYADGKVVKVLVK